MPPFVPVWFEQMLVAALAVPGSAAEAAARTAATAMPSSSRARPLPRALGTCRGAFTRTSSLDGPPCGDGRGEPGRGEPDRRLLIPAAGVSVSWRQSPVNYFRKNFEPKIGALAFERALTVLDNRG